jgi:methyl-branched lipid omega-hydroxylase
MATYEKSKLPGMEPREVLTLEQIDLSDMSFWGRPWEEREGAFRVLRREQPLAFFEEPVLPPELAELTTRGPGYRAVTRHAHIAEISRHPEIYKSGKGATGLPDLPEELAEYFGSLVNADNPRHAHLRRIVSAAFSPRVIRGIEGRIELVANDIINKVAGQGACDFAVEVAAQLPVQTICDLMGVGAADYGTVLDATNVITACGNGVIGAEDPEFIPPGTNPLVSLIEASQRLTMLMSDLAEVRRSEPTDDVTSALVNTNIDGESLSSAEIASFFILLLVAGSETTRNAISQSLLAFTEHPDQRVLWQDDPEGIAATGVDEIVRWSSPIHWMRRTVAEPTVLGEVELCPGDKLLLFYSSANRDEEVFEQPYAFDVRRSPNPHLGFGASGPHYCMGVHLAKREIAVMVSRLLERLPDIAACGPPERLRSTFINGIKHLDCEFTPVAAP